MYTDRPEHVIHPAGDLAKFARAVAAVKLPPHGPERSLSRSAGSVFRNQVISNTPPFSNLHLTTTFRSSSPGREIQRKPFSCTQGSRFRGNRWTHSSLFPSTFFEQSDKDKTVTAQGLSSAVVQWRRLRFQTHSSPAERTRFMSSPTVVLSELQREEVYELVWSKPVSRLAIELNIKRIAWHDFATNF